MGLFSIWKAFTLGLFHLLWTFSPYCGPFSSYCGLFSPYCGPFLPYCGLFLHLRAIFFMCFFTLWGAFLGLPPPLQKLLRVSMCHYLVLGYSIQHAYHSNLTSHELSDLIEYMFTRSTNVITPWVYVLNMKSDLFYYRTPLFTRHFFIRHVQQFIFLHMKATHHIQPFCGLWLTYRK